MIQCIRHSSARMSLCVVPPRTASREFIILDDGSKARVCDLFAYWQCRECGRHYAEPKQKIETTTAATA